MNQCHKSLSHRLISVDYKQPDAAVPGPEPTQSPTTLAEVVDTSKEAYDSIQLC